MSCRSLRFADETPSDCFIMPAPIVFLGDALCSGNGTIPVQIPSIKAGLTSRCVCCLVRSCSLIATSVFSSSSASTYSTTPSFIRSSKVSLPLFISCICCSVIRDLPFSTMISGLLVLPLSVLMTTSLVFE